MIASMIRTATASDVAETHAMIRELAEYERAVDQVQATREQIHEALFGEHPTAFALVAEDETTGETVGFALWYLTFSTWTGVQGMHLEDLYVRPHARGAGHGKALLIALAAICHRNGYERFEWWVLSWNEPTIEFYKSLGAQLVDELTVCRLSGAPLKQLAAQSTAVATDLPPRTRAAHGTAGHASATAVSRSARQLPPAPAGPTATEVLLQMREDERP